MSGEFVFGPAVRSVSRDLAALDPSIVLTALDKACVTGLYPKFDDWFWTKVVRGLRTGERRIFTHVAGGNLEGVAICKRTDSERKLCTLWVAPHVRGRGVAAELARDAFAWLGTRHPVFTVPEERLSEFRGLLSGWSFSEPVAYEGFYRPERTEYVFNGTLGRMAH